MASILYKWFIVASLGIVFLSFGNHPLYISVTEIEHNAKEKTLEISCRIFTDDFEKTLRKTYNKQVDLLNAREKESMSKLVNDYITNHLKISLEGKSASMHFIGYEQSEEAIISYFEVDKVVAVKNISIINDVLYGYKKEQMSFIHVTVDGKRKSSKLNNPDEKISFEF